MLSNLGRLMVLINDGGVNDVSNARPVDGGIVVTLSHKATSDEACSIFIPQDKIVFWRNDERHNGSWGDIELDRVVEEICHA